MRLVRHVGEVLGVDFRQDSVGRYEAPTSAVANWPAAECFLDSLSTHLYFGGVPPASHVFALDRYSVESASGVFDQTEVGSLIHRAKYQGNETETNECGIELAERIATCVRSHPFLASSEVVAGVPSTSGGRFSERLARRVARILDLPLVELELADPGGGLAKDGFVDQVFGLAGEMEHGATALVVDDVMGSGATLRKVAELLRAHHCRDVVAVAAAKARPKSNTGE